jgi:hypothetical protein
MPRVGAAPIVPGGRGSQGPAGHPRTRAKPLVAARCDAAPPEGCIPEAVRCPRCQHAASFDPARRIGRTFVARGRVAGQTRYLRLATDQRRLRNRATSRSSNGGPRIARRAVMGQQPRETLHGQLAQPLPLQNQPLLKRRLARCSRTASAS